VGRPLCQTTGSTALSPLNGRRRWTHIRSRGAGPEAAGVSIDSLPFGFQYGRGMRKTILVLAIFGSAVMAPAAPHQYKYLPADCSALVGLLPPPPATNSPAGIADLETVLQVQADRTPGQVQRARRVASQSVFTFAQPVLGGWFNPTNCPATQRLLAEITRESQTIVDDQVKPHWQRLRPYQASPDVRPIVGRPGNTSYPSGHAAVAALWGTILSAAFPDQAAAFQAQIREVMWCRVIGGVHYPSDTAAGARLGTAIAHAMLAAPAMPETLETIRAEAAPFRNPATTRSAAPVGQ